MDKIDRKQKIISIQFSSKSKGKFLFNNWFLVILSIFILLCGIELPLRIYCQFRHKIPFFARGDIGCYDSILGWEGTKIMGNPQSKRTKIFFVGDSFTYQSLDKNDIYYGVIDKNIDIELFVYGGPGYGTLQEYLVIDKYIDEIKPDLIVLQTCSNDFINNSWNLERRSYIHNNNMVRPYYENGKIKYHFPRWPVFLRQYTIPYSRLAYLIAVRIDRKLAELAGKRRITTVENFIETKGLEYNEFKQAVITTLELMRMIKKRCGNIPIIAFPVFDDEPYFSRFKHIFNDIKVDFLADIPRLAWDAEGRGKVGNDDHWSKKGHGACGEYLTNYIKNNFLKK